jgi:hypothetical protein
MLDGNKIQKPSLIWKMVRTIWNFMDDTAIRPTAPYYRLKRENRQQTQEAIWRLSYLAKGRGKQRKPQ